jgi:hypothetical protein
MMAESLEKMMRSGAISAKHALKIGRSGTWAHGPKGTKSQKGLMAPFESKDTRMGDERTPPRGASHATRNHINGPDQKMFTPPGTISKGGRVGRGGQPTRNQIDQEQGPKFPAGATVKARGRHGVGKNQRSRSNPPERDDDEQWYSGRNGRP